MKKRWWKCIQRHRKKVIALLIATIILLMFFSTQIALFFNFVIGNDIAVKLKVSPEYMQLVHGQKESLTVEASVTTNPFCKAVCSSQFEDVSDGKVLDNTSFTLRPSDPFQQNYEITAPLIGEGLTVYRFSMECHSVQTIFCHTSEEPSTRSVLVTAEYTLTKDEKDLRSALQQQLQAISQKISAVEGKIVAYEKIVSQINVTIDLLPAFSNQLQTLYYRLREAEPFWQQQNFSALAKEISEINTLLSAQEQQQELLAANVTNLVERYNQMIENVFQSRQLLESFFRYDAANATARAMMNDTVDEFNGIVALLSQPAPFEQKENTAGLFFDKINATISFISTQQREDVLKKELETNIDYDLLCEITGVCHSPLSLSELANQTSFSLNQTCENSNMLRSRILDLNSSFRDEYITENYPAENTFTGSISAQFFNLQQQKIKEYRENISENSTNTPLLKELLVEKPLRAAEEYPGYNLTPAFVAELTAQLPASCTALPVVIPEISDLNLTSIEIPAAISTEVSTDIHFTFIEPQPQCCLFGECRACCISDACRNDPSTYPVVFIHGHAVSKDTSFEYSLEGFNKMQKKLEGNGYLSAGSITLYTSREVPEGIWGKLPVPVSIRASYYFDLFQQPENYVVVQTKSENIDTYAVRLKEVIDTIKYKTGKPKVNIVAFSMGSLVSRRYIQIFGSENVNKLILIGAPNKGIVGHVADYCPLTGEQRECLDMQADSLFMNKLNRGSLPNIPIYNIIGTGCEMDGKQGDGAVLEENARLEGAQNFIIKGTCESVSKPLHLQLRDINKYPQVYEVVRKALRE